MEADCASVAVGHEDLAVAVRKLDTDKLVAFAYDDGLFAFGEHSRILCERGFLDKTVLCSKDKIVS